MQQEQASSWAERVKGVWPYATAATTLMFLSCCLVGWFVAWQLGARALYSYVLAAADPAVGAIAMLVVCVFVPDVFAGKRFKAPHVVTLPCLYMLVVFGVKSLSRSTVSGVQRVEGAGRFDMIWHDVRIVLAAFVVLVLVLSLIGAFLREKGAQE